MWRDKKNVLRAHSSSLVAKQSACLDGHRRIPLDARHAMMNIVEIFLIGEEAEVSFFRCHEERFAGWLEKG